MTEIQKKTYAVRGALLVKNLQKRHFDAWYCEDASAALEKVLELIPKGASVGWGGATSAQQIGLLDAIRQGEFAAIDRDTAKDQEERDRAVRQCFSADFFLTGANAISVTGEMVNIDGMGNRVAAIVFGPENVIVVAGMNKVVDTLEAAVTRARTIAAPMNKQRFPALTGCAGTGVCTDCKAEGCICNQILITRHCRPAGRIKFILVGEDLGF